MLPSATKHRRPLRVTDRSSSEHSAAVLVRPPLRACRLRQTAILQLDTVSTTRSSKQRALPLMPSWLDRLATRDAGTTGVRNERSRQPPPAAIRLPVVLLETVSRVLTPRSAPAPHGEQRMERHDRYRIWTPRQKRRVRCSDAAVLRKPVALARFEFDHDTFTPAAHAPCSSRSIERRAMASCCHSAPSSRCAPKRR